MKGAVFSAYYDNKARLNLAPGMEGKPSPLVPGQRLPNGQTNMVPRWFHPGPAYSATGKWSGTAPNYLVTLANKNGSATSQAKVQGGKLVFQFEGKALAFEKLPY